MSAVRRNVSASHAHLNPKRMRRPSVSRNALKATVRLATRRSMPIVRHHASAPTLCPHLPPLHLPPAQPAALLLQVPHPGAVTLPPTGQPRRLVSVNILDVLQDMLTFPQKVAPPLAHPLRHRRQEILGMARRGFMLALSGSDL